MDRIISTKSPRSRARDYSKPHKQSTTDITRNTILFNTLTNKQRLPARPRDFRINLAEEEKNIGSSELSDILTFMVNQVLLEPKRGDFPYLKGRPLSDVKKSGIAKGRTGSYSYYEPSKEKELINEILRDSKSIQLIDNAILNSPIFYRFLKYGFEVYLYQMKEDEDKFMITMKREIMKYGLRHKKANELDNSYILAKDLTYEKIKRLSKGYAINTMKNFKEDGKNILYTVAGLFSLFNVYGLEKESKI